MTSESVSANDPTCTAGYAHERINRLTKKLRSIEEELDEHGKVVSDISERMDRIREVFSNLRSRINELEGGNRE